VIVLAIGVAALASVWKIRRDARSTGSESRRSGSKTAGSNPKK